MSPPTRSYCRLRRVGLILPRGCLSWLAGEIVGAIAPHTEADPSRCSCSCWLRMVR